MSNNILEQLVKDGHERRVFKAYVERVLEACKSSNSPVVSKNNGGVPLYGRTSLNSKYSLNFYPQLMKEGKLYSSLEDFLAEFTVVIVKDAAETFHGKQSKVSALFETSYEDIALNGGFVLGVWKSPYEVRQFYRKNFVKPHLKVGSRFIDTFSYPCNYLDYTKLSVRFQHGKACFTLSDEKMNVVHSHILNMIMDAICTYPKLGQAFYSQGCHEYLKETTIKGHALVEIGRSSLAEFLVKYSELPSTDVDDSIDFLASTILGIFADQSLKGLYGVKLIDDAYGVIELGSLGCYSFHKEG